MVSWADALAGGLRRLSEDLSLLGEPADPAILGYREAIETYAADLDRVWE